MKKILAMILVFSMIPMSSVLAADTPNSDSSTIVQDDSGETRHEDTDSLEKKYNSYKSMDEKEWTDTMGNKDLYGHNKENGDFELTGLMNDLFFNVKDMVPGDSVTKYMRLKNTSNIDYNLYFEANRENAPKAGEIDLFDVLNLKITETGKKLEEPVYDGKIFDQNTHKEVIKLGTIKAGQEPVILTATVSMDSNAGNEYQNKTAQVDWIFRAEGDEDPIPNPPPNPDPTPTPTPDPTPTPSTNGGSKKPNNPNPQTPIVPVNNVTPGDNVPTVDLAYYNSGKGEYKGSVSKTGDSNYVAIYILLACGSLLIGYVLFSKGKKNRKGHEK